MNRQHLVMISGWAHSSDVMLPLADMLGQSFEVHATSPAELLSAAGSNGDLQEGMSPYASGLRRLVERLGDSCLILGWSMGAVIALEMLAKYPMKVKRIIAVSSTARFCSTDGYPFGFGEQNLRAMKMGLTKSPRKVLGQFLRDLSFPSSLSENAIEERMEMALAAGTDVLTHGLNYLLKTDLRTRLAGITIPALVIHGRQDKIIPWQAGEFMCNHLPNNRFVVCKDAGHDVLCSHAANIASEIQS